MRKLSDPRVGASAHARPSGGTINSVTEYDARPEFGNTVYCMSRRRTSYGWIPSRCPARTR